MKILGNRLLAEIIIDDKKTAGGIILPSQQKFHAKVLIVGPKVKHLKIGDKISYFQGVGTTMEYDGKDCIFLEEEFECELVL
jgi:co-chaperonin GroES (HSP10)